MATRRKMVIPLMPTGNAPPVPSRRKMVIPPMPTGNAPPVPLYVNGPNNEFNLNTIGKLRSKRKLYSSNINKADIEDQEKARNDTLLKLYGLHKATSKSIINPNNYDSFFLPKLSKPSKLQSSNFPKSMIANNNDPFANYNAPVSNPFIIDPKLSINDTPPKSKRLPPLTKNPLYTHGGRRKTRRHRKQKTRRHRKH